jgi:hypothetical protein
LGKQAQNRWNPSKRVTADSKIKARAAFALPHITLQKIPSLSLIIEAQGSHTNGKVEARARQKSARTKGALKNLDKRN